MADQQWVLVHTESGQEFAFSSRAEYLNTKAQGGYRDKKHEPRQVQPEPRRDRPVPRREPVNDDPTVEHPAQQ